jgi:hypothetical protein
MPSTNLSFIGITSENHYTIQPVLLPNSHQDVYKTVYRAFSEIVAADAETSYA